MQWRKRNDSFHDDDNHSIKTEKHYQSSTLCSKLSFPYCDSWKRRKLNNYDIINNSNIFLLYKCILFLFSFGRKRFKISSSIILTLVYFHWIGFSEKCWKWQQSDVLQLSRRHKAGPGNFANASYAAIKSIRKW